VQALLARQNVGTKMRWEHILLNLHSQSQSVATSPHTRVQLPIAGWEQDEEE